MDNQPLNIEAILKYLSLLSIMLLIEGILYNLLFYASFNISIMDYLDLSECIAMFIPQSVRVLIFTLVIAPILLFMFVYFTDWEAKRYARRNENNSLGKIIIYTTLGFILPFGTIILLSLFIPKHWVNYFYATLPLIYIFFLAVQLVAYYKNKIANVPKFAINFLFYLIAFTGYTCIESKDQANSLKDNNSYSGFTYTINDTLVKTTDSANVFIGQTKNYFFVYNRRSRLTTITPRNKITKMELRDIH